MHIWRFPLLLVAALAASCGRGPTSPSVASLSITAPGNPILSRQLFQLIAETIRSDGMRTDVSNEAIWQSDNTSIATVSPGGLLTVIRHGSATVTAIHQGRTARTVINVLANFSGAWQGDYGVTSCDTSGVLQTMSACESFSTRGVVPLTLAFNHDYTDLGRVNGLLYFGLYETLFTGSIRPDGHLVGSSLGSGMFGPTTFVTKLEGIDLALTPEGDQLAGAFVVEQTAVGRPGQANVEGAIRVVLRTGMNAGVSSKK